VALVTCRVRGASIDMDSAAEGLDDGSRFREALVQYSNLVRALLMRFYGYECKEPDMGNFTLCFCRLEDALAYCVTLQVGSSLFLSCLFHCQYNIDPNEFCMWNHQNIFRFVLYILFEQVLF
jgi:hypothetical protein